MCETIEACLKAFRKVLSFKGTLLRKYALFMQDLIFYYKSRYVDMSTLFYPYLLTSGA